MLKPKHSWILIAPATLFILMLTVGGIVVDYLMPRLVNYGELKNKIQNAIHQSTGIRAEIKTLAIHPTLFSGLDVVFSNNILFDPSDIKVIRAGRIHVFIRYLPLLQHKTSIAKIAFDNIGVYIGEKSFLFHIKKPDTKSGEVLMQDAAVEFNDYDIYVDRYFDGVNKYLLHGNHLALKHIKSELPVELEGWGSGYFGITDPLHRIGRFKLYGRASQALLNRSRFDWLDLMKLHLQLEDGDLSTVSQILTSNHLPLTATGRVGLLAFDIEGNRNPKTLSIRGNTSTQINVNLLRYHFQFDPGHMLFQTRIELTPALKIASLDRIYLQLTSKKFHSTTEGRIVVKSPLNTSTLSIHSDNLSLPIRALELFPNEPADFRQLLSRMDGGLSSTLSINGLVANPQFTGVIKLNKGSILAPNSNTMLAKGLRGHITILSNRDFRLDRLLGTVADSSMLITGEANLDRQTVSARLKANNPDLGKLSDLIEELLPVVHPLQVMRLEGRSPIVLNVGGALRKPDVYGQIALKQAVIRSRADNQPMITNITGKLLLQKQMLRTPGLSLQVANRTISGSGSLDRSQAILNVQAHVTPMILPSLEHAILLMAEGFKKPFPLLQQWAVVGGTGWGDLHLVGQLAHPRFYGTAWIRQAEATDTRHHTHFNNVDTDLRIVDSQISFNPLVGMTRGIAFRAHGSTNPDNHTVNMDLSANQADIAVVKQFLQAYQPTLWNMVTVAGQASGQVHIQGPIQNAMVTGPVQVSNASLEYLPTHLFLHNITGPMMLYPNDVTTAGLKVYYQTVPLSVNGTSDRTMQHYHLNLVSHQVPVQHAASALVGLVPGSAATVRSLNLKSGTADLNLILASALPNHIGGTVLLNHLQARPTMADAPVQLTRLQYNLQSGKIIAPRNALRVNGMRLTVQGDATAKNYKVHVISQRIPLELIRQDRAWLQRVLHQPIPDLYETQGALSVDALLTPAERTATFHFYHAGASMPQLKYPIYDVNGLLRLTLGHTLTAYTDGLSFRYANSPTQLSLDMRGFQDMYLEATGTLAPLLINDFLLGRHSSLIAYTAVPYNINLSGSLGELSGTGRGNNLNLFVNFNVASLIFNPQMEKPAAPGDASLNQATLSSVLHLTGNTLNIEQTHFRVNQNSGLQLEGQISELFRSAKRQVALTFSTEPDLDLGAFSRQLGNSLAEGLDGKIVSNVKLGIVNRQLNAQGDIQFKHVKANALQVSDLDGDVTFKGIQALLNVNHWQTPGVDTGFKGTLTDITRYPVPVADFDAVGKEFIVSEFIQWTNDVLMGKLKQGVLEKFFPNTGHAGTLPFEIENGHVQMAEAIVNNLIVQNYSSTIRVYPNSSFELDHIRAQSAGGNVTGHFTMSPRDNNAMTVHLRIHKMQANAVTRILLNVSNQIFGDLSGQVDYTTEGTTNEEMLANTNGSANLKIENGRLPSIAKIQNLLAAANTISGGLANLNLNDLFHLADPFQTNYFATLTGTAQMVEGIIHTDDLYIHGKNLDFRLAGTVRMIDGFADMVVHGQMDNEIGGALGPLGTLSVGKFLGILPPLRAIIGHIPGVGFVPGFGGPREGKGLAFEAKINGPLIDPGSTKDFHFVK